MGEVVKKVLIWTLRITAWSMMASSFVLILSGILVKIATPINQSIIGDIGALIQIWLPFDLGAVVGWLVTMATLYLTYKIYIIVYDMINSFIGD